VRPWHEETINKRYDPEPGTANKGLVFIGRSGAI
jgi:hypothetical protein